MDKAKIQELKTRSEEILISSSHIKKVYNDLISEGKGGDNKTQWLDVVIADIEYAIETINVWILK